MTAVLHDHHADAKSHTSYKSTQSSRSSVLERAREYTRKMEGDAARRAKSLERDSEASRSTGGTPRSQSAGRAQQGNRISTRERAFASLEKENQFTRPKIAASPKMTATPRTTASGRPSGEMSIATRNTPRESVTSKSPSRSLARRQQPQEGEPQEAVVSPELLVDALSGHEDGLLAIAERLMEHYDGGYDVMGEAIIDAFADVQKLFQHVVEAAHMEGAAFEASRREEEMKELKKQAGQVAPFDDDPSQTSHPQSPAGPVRHDEFIDQDVKDCLTEAIRKGASLKDTNKHMECYDLYEQACQSASALLPVDSDHRGRLQLSIARAESMSPDRGCAILRYAMDDVLRSGMRAGKTPLPDPSKRADVVLSKPKGHPSMNGSTGQAGVVQSSEEALASMVEEMKEIISAPVYKDTPLQDVSRRFWAALQESQKQSTRNEERLEQNLGKLKGDFLLARAEWEEKLTQAQDQADSYKKKYSVLKEGGALMDDARNMTSNLSASDLEDIGGNGNGFGGSASRKGSGIDRARSGVESVASLGSGLANHARSLVGSFACSGINERTGGILASELAAERREAGANEWRERRRSFGANRNFSEQRHDNNNNNNNNAMNATSAGKPRSFREFSPRRVDV